MQKAEFRMQNVQNAEPPVDMPERLVIDEATPLPLC
jgi:hypothetical protein